MSVWDNFLCKLFFSIPWPERNRIWKAAHTDSVLILLSSPNCYDNLYFRQTETSPVSAGYISICSLLSYCFSAEQEKPRFRGMAKGVPLGQEDWGHGREQGQGWRVSPVRLRGFMAERLEARGLQNGSDWRRAVESGPRFPPALKLLHFSTLSFLGSKGSSLTSEHSALEVHPRL